MRRIQTILLLACLAFMAPAGRAQLSPDSIKQLMKEVTYNELQDKECNSFWAYRIEQKIGSQSFVKHQVETEQGPIFRVLQEDGKPLVGDDERKEQERLNNLLNNPSALSKNRESHLQDEERVHRMIAMMPDAFIFEVEGKPEGDIETFSFRPDPNFKPPTYEARVYHGMAGTFIVNTRLKRMVEMRGHLISRIDFGYGLLGYIDKGGEFDIHREQVSEHHWKTDLVNVHVSGRVILLKSVSKEHYEARSQFQPVSTAISLDEAKRLLEQSAAGKSVASLQSASFENR